jgi:hypothetical protein
MVAPKERPASQVVADLKEMGHKVTLKQLSEAFGMKVAGSTPLEGSNRDILLKLATERQESAAAEAALVPAELPTRPVKATKKPSKTAKKAARHGEPGKTEAPLVVKTPEGTQAAAELIDYLSQWPVPDQFPTDAKKVVVQGRTYIQATTVDGQSKRYTLVQYHENLSRRSKLNYGVDIFGDKVSKDIVTKVAKLDGAPGHDATGPIGELLFMNRTQWWWHMLQVGILIWAGELNPTSLDLDQYPQRKNIEPVTWRFRATDLGFVWRVFEDFVENALNITGTERRKFEERYIHEFVSGERTIKMGNEVKSFDDFVVGYRKGTEQQFKQIWDLIQEEDRASRGRRRS